MRRAVSNAGAAARRVAALWGVCLLAVACGSTQGETSGEAPAPPGDGLVQVEVRNNGFSAEDVTVLIQGGVQESLGTVPAGQSRTYEAALEPREYELTALGLRENRSISFRLFGNTNRVIWDMSSDRIIQED